MKYKKLIEKEAKNMSKIKIIKKNDEYSPEYEVGDIFDVEGTWYGGVHITGKSGVPVSLDKEEYEEIAEVKDLPEEVYDEAASYWKKKEAASVKLPREEVLAEVEKYILANNTCALATGSGEFVRCTPIEYHYHDGAFWMFSEGGEKFYALKENKNVCLAIFDKYAGFGKLKGMQVTGTAQIIVPFSEEYNAAAKAKNISVDALKKLPGVMNLIKVVPEKIEFLNSGFKEKGGDSRQSVGFN